MLQSEMCNDQEASVYNLIDEYTGTFLYYSNIKFNMQLDELHVPTVSKIILFVRTQISMEDQLLLDEKIKTIVSWINMN